MLKLVQINDGYCLGITNSLTRTTSPSGVLHLRGMGRSRCKQSYLACKLAHRKIVSNCPITNWLRTTLSNISKALLLFVFWATYIIWGRIIWSKTHFLFWYCLSLRDNCWNFSFLHLWKGILLCLLFPVPLSPSLGFFYGWRGGGFGCECWLGSFFNVYLNLPKTTKKEKKKVFHTVTALIFSP